MVKKQNINDPQLPMNYFAERRLQKLKRKMIANV